jgi:hypothetical protein
VELTTRHKIYAGGAAAVVGLLLAIFVVIPFLLHIAAFLGVAVIAFIGGEVHGRVSARQKDAELEAPGRTTPALPGSDGLIR